jgi:uncharacterized membrane protein
VRYLAETVVHAWASNRHWMAWNLFLAVVPVLFAVRLFRVGRRPTPLWCVGLVLFALFLPNAPYVISDLIHLPGDVGSASTRSSVLFGFLPSYGLFVAAGVLAYAYCLRRVRIWLGARSLDPGWVAMEMAIHLVVAVGVLIGRVARLNSWDAVVRPRTTVWTSLSTVSRPSALLVIVAFAVTLFVACRALSVGLVLARGVRGSSLPSG